MRRKHQTISHIHFERKEKGGLNFRRRRRRFQAEKFREYATFSGLMLLVILAAFLLVQAYGIRTSVTGESMSETLNSGDTVLLNRASYIIKKPEANDIVAFYPTGNKNAKVSIKRIVGIPGDTIIIQRGTLYVNGTVYDDAVSTETMTEAGRASTEIVLKDGEYFVLGDNRNNSEDSRYETIGNILEDEIIGKVWFCISLDNFGTK